MASRTTKKKGSGSKGKNPRKKGRKTPPGKAEAEEDLEVLEFIQAVDRYKRRTQKPFPAWSEILGILKSLGYRKV